MLYRGSCHCGHVAFEAEGEIEAVVACNCSICSRKGALLWAVPRDKLRLLGPEDGIGDYTFNRHVIRHRFCRTCGMHPYAEDADQTGEPSAYVNVRCLEDVDIAPIPTIDFDGKSL